MPKFQTAGFSKNGFLVIERGPAHSKTLQMQYCPHRNGKHNACGDWCSGITEPVIREGFSTTLETCFGEMKIIQFVDYRADRKPQERNPLTGAAL